LPALVRTKRVLLCLDYDGTISEIVQDPAVARPVPGVLEVLAEFGARRDRIAVAIVSGREVATLREILHVRRGIARSGIHGLELVDFEGSEEIMHGARECPNDLDEVRKWLDENVPAGEGFVVEDKRFAVTVHYRNAPTGQGLVSSEARSRNSYTITRLGLRCLTVKWQPKHCLKAQARKTPFARFASARARISSQSTSAMI
jgi:trehalose-phosphatase